MPCKMPSFIGPETSYYALIVQRQEVKVMKDKLESLQLIHARLKIRATCDPSKDVFVIPTSIPVSTSSKTRQLEDETDDSNVPLELRELGYELTVVHNATEEMPVECCNAVLNALKQALHQCQPSLLHQYTPLLQKISRSYCKYHPMLLLSLNAEYMPDLDSLLDALRHSNLYNRLWKQVATTSGVSHVALNAPVPALRNDGAGANVLRSPHDFMPLYGDFGPALLSSPEHDPTNLDFNDAFWASTLQNGIRQIWAPRYTMFSAGNVSEKTRILRMSSVQDAVRAGQLSGQGCSAIDLFAGIGYFAFSYIKAGVSNVLCWDLNPWSIEGLHRGAKANKWSTENMVTSNGSLPVQYAEQSSPTSMELPRLLVFNESNAHAGKRLDNLKNFVPPIRHVNCGMLPSSSQSWKVAIESISASLGGWLHIHETVDEKNKQARAKSIVDMVDKHYTNICKQEYGTPGEHVLLDHIERVKSIAPRLQHVVLDVWIPGRASSVSGRWIERSNSE